MSIPPPERRHVHECDLPYPHMFVDELYHPDYLAAQDEEDGFSMAGLMPGRSVAIDHPRYEDGHLAQCPDEDCGQWWVFRRHATPPGDYGSIVLCTTTYSPRWHRVGWWDFGLRARIREATQ